MYNVYSLADTKAVLYHPYVGTANLHLCGRGRMVVSYAGDLSAHTMTADGTVIINRLKAENGIITLEVPQNSIADDFLRKWCRYLRGTGRPDFFHLTTLTITAFCIFKPHLLTALHTRLTEQVNYRNPVVCYALVDAGAN